MARPTQSAMQRIQVGLIGLLVVLLFASIANMIIDRAGRKADGSRNDNAITVGKSPEITKDEPLAELGVTPVVGGEAQPKAQPAPPPAQPPAQPLQTPAPR
jgi:hypothetical protein